MTGVLVISVYGPPDCVPRYTLYPTTVLDVLAVQLSATECCTWATPVPVSAMLIGVLLAVLATTTLPVTVLPLVGVKVTVNVAVLPEVTTCPAVTPDAMNPAPVSVTADMVTLEFPLLVRITFCALLLPTATFV